MSDHIDDSTTDQEIRATVMRDKLRAEKQPRQMRLPKNSMHPNYNETHLENDWCAKAGCTPVCKNPLMKTAGLRAWSR